LDLEGEEDEVPEVLEVSWIEEGEVEGAEERAQKLLHWLHHLKYSQQNSKQRQRQNPMVPWNLRKRERSEGIEVLQEGSRRYTEHQYNVICG
jgi:hypothetical protein